MNEHIQTIKCYADQIEALLDLMQTTKGADIDSINVAAEMCMNMFYDLMDEVERMKDNN